MRIIFNKWFQIWNKIVATVSRSRAIAMAVFRWVACRKFECSGVLALFMNFHARVIISSNNIILLIDKYDIKLAFYQRSGCEIDFAPAKKSVTVRRSPAALGVMGLIFCHVAIANNRRMIVTILAGTKTSDFITSRFSFISIINTLTLKSCWFRSVLRGHSA